MFTVKDGPDLLERLKHLVKSYTKMMMDRKKARARSRGHSSPIYMVEGATANIEIKRGEESGLWHPHIHAVWLCERALPFGAAQAEWQRIAGQGGVAWVKFRHLNCQWDKLAGVIDDTEFHERFTRQLCEVYKYNTAFPDLEYSEIFEIARKTKRFRMMRTHGTLFGLEPKAELVDDHQPDWCDVDFEEAAYEFESSTWAGWYRSANLSEFNHDRLGNQRPSPLLGSMSSAGL
ncbi:MAG: protein rep [bacterium]|nr:protein rep [bacterium]